jgi:CRISPR/Cas system-associated exonuclease Cas4 (RecB family)
VSIALALLHAYPTLNEAQRTIVSHSKGPLLIIAGPGSGKTFSLVLRAMNLLVLGKTVPRELVLCTFTEKAAFELRDRMAAAAHKIGYTGDLSELKVSTIHGLCNRLLTTHRHRTPLGNNYETLEELTHLLFIFEHFETIVGPEYEGHYLGKWATKWSAIEGVRGYFDKITEKLIDPVRLCNAVEPFLRRLGVAYMACQRALFSNNRLDFAHQQRLVYDLLCDPLVADALTRDVRYVMVDEYQDTNFIQEQLLLKLSAATRNLCVVGDEDQSLYRFRGATVRNILEFTTRVPNCTVVKLTTNYRSHKRIVQTYDRWMASADWSNPRGLPFRYDKTIQPDLTTEHPDYPAVFCIWGRDEQDEVQRFADMVVFLKEHDVIADYNQVALLLHSVRQEHSGLYLAALEAKGIPAFCPRARAYFENDEVRLMVACLAVIFGYNGEGRGQVSGSALAELADYIDAGIVALVRRYGGAHLLAAVLRGFVADIEGQKDLLASQSFVLKDRLPVKRAFSFTSDIKVYETCPRQYQFFREYDFTPSRSAVIFFGLLVHQTIEEIHRRVLDSQFATLNETRIRELFERTFTFLSLSDVHPIGAAAKDSAFTQVMHYFLQNQAEMQRVIETEVGVSVEKDRYILTGKVDLLLGGDGRLELLDFKTSPRPVHSPALLASYERQLCTYAHILETRYGKRPDRLLLYWTAEPRKQDALMEFPYRPERVAAAGTYFDQVVAKILQKDFTMQSPPEPNICKECDFRRYCAHEGTIRLEDET